MREKKTNEKTREILDPDRGVRWGAVLCALRPGPRTADRIAASVGDRSTGDTFVLLREMATAGHVAFEASRTPSWFLCDPGRDYLRRRGVE